jgi:gas vesicle protein
MNSSFLTGLIIGCIIGAIGQYCVKKLTGTRKKVEQNKAKQNEWDALFNTYPSVMEQMKRDINEPAHAGIKEFFVVDKSALMNSSVPRLRYDLSEEIIPALNRLEEAGYIQRVPNDSLLYKMDEDFIRLLKLQQ